jgi:hypothetical protein
LSLLKEDPMSGWVWVLIVVAVLALIAVVAWRALASRRTRSLQDRFGPEYGRAAETAGSKRRAEAELAAREERREQLTIRPLPAEARRRYASQWQLVQVQFVDSPVAAVSSADALVTTVMTDRGYPLDDFEQRAADVSVDHPELVGNYRQAREISSRSADGRATTEELRQAMTHYRSLFDELLGAATGDNSSEGPISSDEYAVPANTGQRGA